MDAFGKVVAISGAQVTCLARADADLPDIGQLVRLPVPGGDVYGSVGALRADAAHPDRLHVMLDLLGEVGADGKFQRGVSAFPKLGAAALPAGEADHAKVYARPGGAALRLGTLAQDPARAAYVQTDEMLTKHFAVLGTTGSGKSCTVALILRRLLDANPHGHVVVLDPHAEYAAAFADIATVLDTGSLQLPLWMMDFEETVAVLVKGGTPAERESQIAILKDAIVQAKRKFAGDGADCGHVTVDTPAPYRPGDLLRIVDAAMGKLDKPDTTLPYQRLKLRLESLAADRRFGFMMGGLMMRDVLAEVIGGILSIPTAGRPMTVIDLSGVPSEVVDIVVSMLCRMLFDFAVWSERRTMPPLLLVCEEAHRYVPAERGEGFAATRRAIERIAKEGRKYGVGLALVSQRPSELSPSILSQCGTIFALRMGNDRDKAFVAAMLADNAKSLTEMLPALRRQEALAIGEGVSVPLRVRLDTLAEGERPRSGSVSFAAAWQSEAAGRDFLDESVARWRRQIRQTTPPATPAPAPASAPASPATPQAAPAKPKPFVI